jgi:hypothetical protein
LSPEASEARAWVCWIMLVIWDAPYRIAPYATRRAKARQVCCYFWIFPM